MKKRNIIGIAIGALLILALAYLNHRYEVVALHPFFGSDDADLKVMTWNVHCPERADSIRQRNLAEVILKEDADIVLLNEFHQDSCLVLDSMLRTKYAYTEEYQSHRKAGDIFYSKQMMSNSGHVWIPVVGKSIPTIKATIAARRDSIQIFGVHMTGNNKSETAVYDSLDTEESMFVRYKGRQALRDFQASWTVESVKESTHPVIVMGDMNDFSFSEPLKALTGIGLKNAWWEGGTGYGCTFHSRWMRLRIDHIFHSEDLRLTDVKVIQTNISDHNPVVASFKVM